MTEATSTKQFQHLTPVLGTQDISKTIRYYQQTLRFEKVFDYGSPVFYAGVSRDGFDFHVSHRDQVSVLPDRDSESVDIYITVADVDRPWGSEFRRTDA